MAADLAAIRTALASTLGLIPGLRAYGQAQSQINPPCAIVTPVPAGMMMRFDTFEGGITYALRATIYVQYAEDASSQAALDAYLGTGNSSSIWAILRANPRLGGVVDDATMTGVKPLGLVQVAGQDYLAADVTVAVMAS